MQHPEFLTLLYVPLMLTPVALVFWYLASMFKRVEWFAWASIFQVSICVACMAYVLFASSRLTGLAAGLVAGLAVAYAGKSLYKKSR